MEDLQLVENRENWMSEVPCITTEKLIDRHDQIREVLERVRLKYTDNVLEIKPNIGYDLKFKPDVIFQDVGPVMRSSALFKHFMTQCIGTLVAHQISHVDYVVGIDARGFYFGPILAEKLDAGFVPIRKKNKLPGEVVTKSYKTEYSTDTVEIQVGAFTQKKGVTQTVLIVDDLVATGGSLIAACELVESLSKEVGCLEIVGCFCPLKVDGLVDSARDKLMSQVCVKLITL